MFRKFKIVQNITNKGIFQKDVRKCHFFSIIDDVTESTSPWLRWVHRQHHFRCKTCRTTFILILSLTQNDPNNGVFHFPCRIQTRYPVLYSWDEYIQPAYRFRGISVDDSFSIGGIHSSWNWHELLLFCNCFYEAIERITNGIWNVYLRKYFITMASGYSRLILFIVRWYYVNSMQRLRCCKMKTKSYIL